MVVLCWTTSGSYLLAKLDRAVSRLCYAIFQLLPHYPCFSSNARVADLTGIDDENLDKMAGEDAKEPDEEDPDSYELA